MSRSPLPLVELVYGVERSTFNYFRSSLLRRETFSQRYTAPILMFRNNNIINDNDKSIFYM